jgi:signal transduction histidine kinase
MGLLDPHTKSETSWKARLKLLLEGAGELRKNFQAIQAQFHDVTAILDEYLHLTGRRTVVRQPVQIKELVSEVMAEVYTNRRPTLSYEILSDALLPAIPGDPELMRFIIRTLVRNALEAIPNETGKVIVAVKNRSDKGFIELTVQDSGKGIAPHLVPRLFQPFFTTKENRQGLNLSRAKRYVDLHGGRLELSETGPQGTTFRLELPMNIPPNTLMPSSASHRGLPEPKPFSRTSKESQKIDKAGNA